MFLPLSNLSDPGELRVDWGCLKNSGFKSFVRGKYTMNKMYTWVSHEQDLFIIM